MRFLDIGCGEGWALNYFSKKKWDVVGLDYTNHACKHQNPEFAKFILTGDIHKTIDVLIKEDQRFDVIWLENVLEHVLAPLKLLQKIKKLIKNYGVLLIEVPNDFSIIQKYLYDNQYINILFGSLFLIIFPISINQD